MQCPNCTTWLTAEGAPDAPRFTCAGCDGTFVPAEGVARLATEEGLVAALVAALEPVAVVPHLDVRYRACPRCGALMNRHAFARGARVVVDTCRAHGTWFERGELRAVAAFIERGGLLESARREAEEVAERARAARVDAVRSQLGGALTQAGAPPGPFDRWRREQAFWSALSAFVEAARRGV